MILSKQSDIMKLSFPTFEILFFGLTDLPGLVLIGHNLVTIYCLYFLFFILLKKNNYYYFFNYFTLNIDKRLRIKFFKSFDIFLSFMTSLKN